MDHSLCCPVCGEACSLLDVVDFNKSCEEARGKFFPLAGIPVYYVLCNNCGFSFAPAIASWKLEEFEQKIYNDEYILVDPDYIETRPRANAAHLISMFGDRADSIKHLDYGGGGGLLVKLLRESNWQSTSYDPFVDRNVGIGQLGKFDLITAFEVFEHVPDVQGLMSNLCSLLSPNGIVLFSTLLSDGNIHSGQRINWWYASPRNGHISLFSRKSLTILAQNNGFCFGSLSEGFHFFHTEIPRWVDHIIRASNVAIPQPPKPMAIDDALLQALTHHKQGQFKDAEGLYHAILDVQPDHPDANHSLGLLAMQLGQSAVALSCFKTALNADQNRGQFWLSYINALIQSGSTDEAKNVLESGLQRGLNGEAVEALAARLKDAPGAVHKEKSLPSSLQVSQHSRKGSKGKQASSSAKKIAHNKNPGSREMDTLANLFAKGRYKEVAILAEQMTERFPKHGFGWKALGTVLLQMGRAADALAPMQQAAALSSGDAETYKNLGILLKGMKRLPEAEAAYLRAIELKPDYLDAHNNLGILLHEMKRLPEAEAAYLRATKLKPDVPEAHNNLGNLYKDTKRLPEAEAAYLRAIELKPDYLDAHNNLGLLLHAMKRLPEAEAAYLRAIELNPDHVEAHNNLGNLLAKMKRFPEAEAAYLRAIELNPDYADAHNNLGSLLADQKRIPEAEAAYLRAIELNPDHVEAHNNLGNLLAKMQRFPEAEAAYLRTLELKPDFSELHHNLGILFKDTERALESEAAFLRAIELEPDYGEAKLSLAFLLFSLGRYAEAWPYYEFRHHPSRNDASVVNPDLSCPLWQGESLLGKSLLIYPEQGFGDYIQFARYAPMLKDRGVSRLTFFCAQPLKALLETMSGVDAVITELAAAPSHDYWSYPLSLPLHFGTTLDNLPATLPYLKALPERVRNWQDRIPNQGFRVGLVWKGNPDHKNDDNRSLPGLSTLSPLWTIPGVTFVSLQKGQGEVESSQTLQPITHLGSDIRDFADTAAIVAQLDLLICVDTAAAHVAGALGKPCWVLLPAYGTDWRWLLDRGDSPWYPGVMRIFRQSKGKEWKQTIDQMAVELNTLVASIAGANRTLLG